MSSPYLSRDEHQHLASDLRRISKRLTHLTEQLCRDEPTPAANCDALSAAGKTIAELERLRDRLDVVYIADQHPGPAQYIVEQSLIGY